ncbi:MAG: alkaline phosphatase family protein [Gemmatimonadales bacterium]|jgi:predicted AlkP superfamily pyrophosphatase or phosphodiesterase
MRRIPLARVLFALAASLTAVAAGASAQARPATQAPAARPSSARPRPLPASAPRLVVVVTVDQMRADYLERFKSQFTGGFARMLRTGADFTDAYQDHAMTETAVGHSTILSGRYPSSHGIVRNSEGVPDADYPLLDVRGPGASPLRFRGTALFDWLQARSPASRMLSISRKDRGAILPVGRSKQMVFWFAGGQFTTSRYYADTLPEWIRAVNARAVPIHAAGRAWELLLPVDSYPEPDIAPWENGGTNLTFPHQMPTDTTAAKRTFLLMPWMDQLTLDAALAGVQATRLGRGPAPDVLAVSLSTTDAIGHAYGPQSREIHDQIVRLDRELGTFLDSLAKLRDPRRTVVVLTADHGVTPFTGWSRRNGFPLAEDVSFDTLIRATYDSLVRRAGPGQWIRFFDLGLLAMDRAGLTARGVNVDSVVNALAVALRSSHAVLRVDTPRSLAQADTAQDAIARRWRNAIPPDLGAELMVTLKPKFVLGDQTSAEHGQPSDDDTHVPLLFWGAGIRAGTFAQRVSVVDIAPTLAALLGVEPTEPIQGRALREALTRR